MSATDALPSSSAHSPRRHPWLNPADERAARLRQQRLLQTLEERLQMPRVGPEAASAAVQRVYSAELVFHHRLALWRFDYTAGVSLCQLSADLHEAIRAYGLWRWLFDRLFARRSPSTTVQAPGDLRDPVHYRDFLQLLALCRLFGLEDRIPALVQPQLERDGMDVLLAALAHLPLTTGSGAPRWADAPPALRVLQHALAVPGPEGDRRAIEAYCATLRHAGADAQGAGDRAAMEPNTDWAFEAAALCMRGTAGIEAEAWPRDLAWVGTGGWISPSTRRRAIDTQPLFTRAVEAVPVQRSVRLSSNDSGRISEFPSQLPDEPPRPEAIGLALARLGERLRRHWRIELHHTEEVRHLIADGCGAAGSGACTLDELIDESLMPAISRELEAQKAADSLPFAIILSGDARGEVNVEYVYDPDAIGPLKATLDDDSARRLAGRQTAWAQPADEFEATIPAAMPVAELALP